MGHYGIRTDEDYFWDKPRDDDRERLRQLLYTDPEAFLAPVESQSDRIERKLDNLDHQIADLATAVSRLTLEMQLKSLGITDLKKIKKGG